MDKIVNPNDVNRIVANTVFKGVFTSESDIRIDGKLVPTFYITASNVTSPDVQPYLQYYNKQD